MNDNDFDGYVKNILENTEGPDPSPEMLLDFHSRMQKFHQIPWYSRYRVPLATAAVLMLFTFVNGMLYLREPVTTPAQNMTYVVNDSYKREVDSLVIYTNVLRNEVKLSLQMISRLNQAGPENRQATALSTKAIAMSGTPKNIFDLGDINKIAPEVLAKLQTERMIKIIDGHAFLAVTDTIVRTKRVHYQVDYVLSPQDMRPGDTTIIQTIALKNPSVPRFKAPLPASLINKLEEHNYKGGIGLTLSPHIDVVKTGFSKGEGDISPRFGLRADWIFSSHWSIQTSVDYLSNRVTISANFQNYNLPNLSTSLGTLQQVGISHYMVGLPIAVRYKWWMSANYQLVISAGVTPFFSITTQYKYYYPFPGRPQDSDVNLVTVTEVGNRKYNNSAAAVSFGVIKALKRNRSLEMALFFEQGMLSASTEHLRTNMIGIRTALTLPVR